MDVGYKFKKEVKCCVFLWSGCWKKRGTQKTGKRGPRRRDGQRFPGGAPNEGSRGKQKNMIRTRVWALSEQGGVIRGLVWGALGTRLNVHLLRISYIPRCFAYVIAASPLLWIL